MAIPEIAQAGKLLAEALANLRAELRNVKHTRESEASLSRAVAFLEIGLGSARCAWRVTRDYVTLADRAALQTAKEMGEHGKGS